MKKILAPLLLLFFSLSGFFASAQNGNSLCTVETGKPRPLYASMENRIHIAVSGYSQGEISVSCEEGKISGSGGSFMLTPKKTGKVVLNVNAGGQQVATYNLVSVIAPKPIVAIGNDRRNWRGGIMAKHRLTRNTRIRCVPQGIDDLKYSVVSFDVVVTLKGMTEKHHSNSCKLTQTQLDAIAKVRKNKKIIFDNIKVKSKEGYTVLAGSLVYKLK